VEKLRCALDRSGRWRCWWISGPCMHIILLLGKKTVLSSLQVKQHKDETFF